MAKELYDGIYSSHKLVFIERIEKNIDYYLKNRIFEVKRLQQELFCVLNKSSLISVLKELKENPEFDIHVINSINLFKSKERYCLLMGLSSVANNYSMFLKVLLNSGTDDGARQEYKEILPEIVQIFKAAEFYMSRNNLTHSYNDAVFESQVFDGFDSFDIFLSTDYDIINRAYLDTAISRILPQNFNKDFSLFDLQTSVSRYDYSGGIFPELCLCLAVEELLKIKVSKRVQYIRILLSELYRISSHIYFIARIAKVIGADMAYNFSLLEREHVLRILEEITGSRINPNFIKIGGIKKDFKPETIVNIKGSLSGILKSVYRLETLLLDNSIITAKLKNTGIADKDVALACGATGPNLRASGARYDIRKNRNLMLYKDLSFLVAMGKFGDCLERVQIRFREIYQSIKIIDQIAIDLPEEYIKKPIDISEVELEFSEMVSSVECPHGVFKTFIEMKDNRVLNFIVLGPSRNSLYLAEKILPGNRVEDVELILASLDICSGELMS
jgi:NADH-quinone oxidoreductase subunit D